MRASGAWNATPGGDPMGRGRDAQKAEEKAKKGQRQEQGWQEPDGDHQDKRVLLLHAYGPTSLEHAGGV